MKKEIKQLSHEERKKLIHKMANRICDKYEKAFRMLAEDEAKDLNK